MKRKVQIMLIHGGNTFKSRKDYFRYLKDKKIKIRKKENWVDSYLENEMGDKLDIIKPRMPLGDFAKYKEWKLYFEKYFPYLRNGLILVGGSLGGIFLAKYLSENKFPKKLRAVYMMCPPYDGDLPGEELVGGFKLKRDLSLIEKNCKKVTLMFSEDDDVVPISHAEKYRKKLKNANIIIYKSKNGHFNISTFPEMIGMLQEDLKKPSIKKTSLTNYSTYASKQF